jgi:REP element-mobilizing transposase RayT
VGKARKTHVQQLIRWPNAAGDLRGRKREGGKGRGKHKLGRPKKANGGQPHDPRPQIDGQKPVHITLRVVRDIGRLRKRACYAAIREAAITLLRHEDCRVTQLSIQGTHIHMLVEADDRRSLSRGMQAFQISAAKHLNAAVSRAGSWWQRRRLARAGQALTKRRKGRVFSDRYHARVITTPMQARRELAYVLNNWRKHGEDRKAIARNWIVDPFSTGWCFNGWRERKDEPFLWPMRQTYEDIPVYGARSWLLREGWRRHGLISTHEVPSARGSG